MSMLVLPLFEYLERKKKALAASSQ